MTYLEYFLLYVVLHLPVLFALYWAWIKHEKGGWWKLCHVFGVLGFGPDVLANHTSLALIFYRWPKPDAWTFSQQLEHLCKEGGARGVVANMVADVLDRVAPSGKHIKRQGQADD